MAVRRKENAFDKVSVNSLGKIPYYLGFMGSLLFKDEKVMEDFMNNHTPSSILEDICLQWSLYYLQKMDGNDAL